MKKWLALMLVLLVAVSMMALAGCSGEETVTGVWRAQMGDLKDRLVNYFGEETIENMDSAYHPIYGYYEFCEDGTFKVYTKDDELEAAYITFRADLIAAVSEMLDEPADGSGEVTYRDVMESEGFSSVAEMVDARFEKDMVLGMAVEFDGTYTKTETEIILTMDGDEKTLTYVLEDDKLTLTDENGETLNFTKE